MWWSLKSIWGKCSIDCLLGWLILWKLIRYNWQSGWLVRFLRVFSRESQQVQWSFNVSKLLLVMYLEPQTHTKMSLLDVKTMLQTLKSVWLWVGEIHSGYSAPIASCYNMYRKENLVGKRTSSKTMNCDVGTWFHAGWVLRLISQERFLGICKRKRKWQNRTT